MSYYWGGEIGGIELIDTDGETAGFDLLGADAFESKLTGNTRPGMLGNPHTQYGEIEYGKQLELKFLHIPQTLARNLLDLLKELNPGAGLECTFSDDFQTITGVFKPNVPNWYERGLTDGDYLKDFVIRIVNIKP